MHRKNLIVIPLRPALAPYRNVAIYPVKLSRVLTWAAVATCALSLARSAKSAPPPPEAPLSFKVTARVSYKVPGESPLPAQTVQAKVLVRGENARVETALGGQPTVLLYAPPYFYRLLPSSKAGVRYKPSNRRSRGDSLTNYRDLLRSPAKMRAALLEGGAKKLQDEKLAGLPVEKYEIRNFRGEKNQVAQVWLRKSDALPARLEISGSSLLVHASWSDYSRPRNVPSSIFAPPAGYKIRDSISQAPSPQL